VSSFDPSGQLPQLLHIIGFSSTLDLSPIPVRVIIESKQPFLFYTDARLSYFWV